MCKKYVCSKYQQYDDKFFHTLKNKLNEHKTQTHHCWVLLKGTKKGNLYSVESFFNRESTFHIWWTQVVMLRQAQHDNAIKTKNPRNSIFTRVLFLGGGAEGKWTIFNKYLILSTLQALKVFHKPQVKQKWNTFYIYSIAHINLLKIHFFIN